MFTSHGSLLGTEEGLEEDPEDHEPLACLLLQREGRAHVVAADLQIHMTADVGTGAACIASVPN